VFSTVGITEWERSVERQHQTGIFKILHGKFFKARIECDNQEQRITGCIEHSEKTYSVFHQRHPEVADAAAGLVFGRTDPTDVFVL
jgi:deoxyxylulose-5-phosphate synthase